MGVGRGAGAASDAGGRRLLRGVGGQLLLALLMLAALPLVRPLPQDNLIIGAVVAACTLFILIYWWRK